MLKEIIIAIQSYNEARQFIRENRLWKWILMPGLIYTLLFLIGMYFFIGSATSVIEYLTRVSHVSEWIQKLENSWVGFLFALAGMMLWLLLLLFYFSLFKYAWLIIGSPIFTYLSERTQAILEKKEFSFNSRQFFRDVSPGVKVALRNCAWQTGYLFLLMLFSMVPLVGMIAPVIALFVECYYYGYSMISYSLDREKVAPEKSAAFIKEHKGLAIGNGIIFYLMHIVIIFAPAYAIIAATLSVHKVKPA
ncbi:MAG: EI24 domain-containing protein [Chitinophagaceae bacterium]|nr:EI24 domain-containing protein [Chitinophagaceae bacterium]